MKKIALTRAEIRREAIDYLMISIGMLSYCIGWSVFLLPNNMTTGGVPGIAAIIEWSPLHIPAQLTYFAINGCLLVAALKVLGLKFCMKTIYGVVLVTTATSLLRPLLSDVHLLQDQPFMASIIGAVFCGSGIGLGLVHHGSGGGTEIVASIVNKYKDLGGTITKADAYIRFKADGTPWKTNHIELIKG